MRLCGKASSATRIRAVGSYIAYVFAGQKIAADVMSARKKYKVECVCCAKSSDTLQPDDAPEEALPARICPPTPAPVGAGGLPGDVRRPEDQPGREPLQLVSPPVGGLSPYEPEGVTPPPKGCGEPTRVGGRSAASC